MNTLCKLCYNSKGAKSTYAGHLRPHRMDVCGFLILMQGE